MSIRPACTPRYFSAQAVHLDAQQVYYKSEVEECKEWLTAYRNLFAFLSQVIPFQDLDLEKLHSYIWFLLTKLPSRKSRVAMAPPF